MYFSKKKTFKKYENDLKLSKTLFWGPEALLKNYEKIQCFITLMIQELFERKILLLPKKPCV